MATPCELSLSEVRKYLLDNGGSARNRDLVKHFKSFLTDPENRVEARNVFKKYVNTLATIRNEDGEKYLVLKSKYLLSLETDLPSPLDVQLSSESLLSPSEILSPTSPNRNPPPYRPPPPPPLQTSLSLDETESLYATVNKSNNNNDFINDYKQIPQDENNLQRQEEEIPPVTSDASSPPVPPRRKSHDKLKLENKENINQGGEKGKEDVSKETETKSVSSELPSVRERMQRFNRMASETDLHGRANSFTPPTKKRPEKGAADEEDNASVGSQLDGKAREWLVRAAQGDYQALAKLAAVEPRLTKLKDPCSGYTALHWGAKHGNENIVKLIAGTYKDYIKSVNETTNGGYTALHIAMQFDHENIFNLLVQVYGANQEIRDHSGRKARQYLTSQEAAVSNDTFRKIKARKKNTEKDLGFLRIGSLNVRVKRTTEAFSQFLGVATSNATNNNDKIHKSWGSADNIQEHKLMPPPKYAPIKKRKSRRATQDFITRTSNNNNTKSNNKRPSSAAAITPTETPSHDSDSDGACGFDSAWRPSPKL